ncbi:MAG: serine/threonine-protein kinase [Aureliella sp.]
MSKLRKPIQLETAFGVYLLEELVGEGGAGRVYAGRGADDREVAIKVLTQSQASADRRRRFKNEIAFLSRIDHPNVVGVLDYGVARDESVQGPFYVMQRYTCSLRSLMQAGIPDKKALAFFGQVLDGVEAAHFKGTVHRDLKPENILYDQKSDSLAIADFGIAQFTEHLMATLVETKPTQRLANFQYAAPEQRKVGGKTSESTDIYALGLILNEMFTEQIPSGTEYRTVGQVVSQFAFLDAVVAQCIRQSPTERPASIAALKHMIRRYESEAISSQRLSEISGQVIKEGEVDDPLALSPPQLVGASWDSGVLTLTLDRPVHEKSVDALLNMGGHTSVWGKGPERFQFKGKTATINASENDAQSVINYFKGWLPQASAVFKHRLEMEAQRKELDLREKLKRERAAEEQKIRLNRSLSI